MAIPVTPLASFLMELSNGAPVTIEPDNARIPADRMKRPSYESAQRRVVRHSNSMPIMRRTKSVHTNARSQDLEGYRRQVSPEQRPSSMPILRRSPSSGSLHSRWDESSCSRSCFERLNSSWSDSMPPCHPIRRASVEQSNLLSLLHFESDESDESHRPSSPTAAIDYDSSESVPEYEAALQLVQTRFSSPKAKVAGAGLSDSQWKNMQLSQTGLPMLPARKLSLERKQST